VPQQIDRFTAGKMQQQGFQIGQVIGIPIGLGRRALSQAKAAPVRRNHMPLLLQMVDHELERCRHIHPAMQHEQLGRSRIAPVAHVITQAADVEKL